MDDYFNSNVKISIPSTTWTKNTWPNLDLITTGTTTIHNNYYEDLLLEKSKLEKTRLSLELLVLKTTDKISSIEMINLLKMLESSDPENYILAKAIIEKFNKELFE